MKRRTVLGSLVVLPLAGCADRLRPEGSLETSLNDEDEGRYVLELSADERTLGEIDIGVLGGRESRNRHVFVLWPGLDEGFSWSSLEMAFSFPGTGDAPGVPEVHVRAEPGLNDVTFGRAGPATTLVTLSETTSQYPSLRFVVETHQEFETLEMEAGLEGRLFEDGLRGTVYEFREEVPVSLTTFE